MATRGFEFRYSLHGVTPTIRDWKFASSTAGFAVGDAVTLATTGLATAVATSTVDVFGVVQEAATAVAASAELKVAIVTPDQVWECSTDATALATTTKLGYTATVPFVDGNTIDASKSTAGGMLPIESSTDDDGNVKVKVLFKSTLWGGRLA